MWVTEYVREIKRQLRDVYGFTPSRMAGDEQCFDDIPDGIYPMTINGDKEWVIINEKKFILGLRMQEPRR